MDIKLAILFLIISAMIALSYLDDDTVARMKQQLAAFPPPRNRAVEVQGLGKLGLSSLAASIFRKM